jgi:hypothetical protein
MLHKGVGNWYFIYKVCKVSVFLICISIYIAWWSYPDELYNRKIIISCIFLWPLYWRVSFHSTLQPTGACFSAFRGGCCPPGYIHLYRVVFAYWTVSRSGQLRTFLVQLSNMCHRPISAHHSIFQGQHPPLKTLTVKQAPVLQPFAGSVGN